MTEARAARIPLTRMARAAAGRLQTGFAFDPEIETRSFRSSDDDLKVRCDGDCFYREPSAIPRSRTTVGIHAGNRKLPIPHVDSALRIPVRVAKKAGVLERDAIPGASHSALAAGVPHLDPRTGSSRGRALPSTRPAQFLPAEWKSGATKVKNWDRPRDVQV